MNYKEIYNEHYNRCYDKTESLIKSYFIKQKKSERTFGYGLQLVKKYLAETVNDKYEFAKDDPLVECYNYFLKRHRLYKSSSSLERILENEIYDCFSENRGQDKTSEKSFSNLIKRIALNECVEEVARIISNDSGHLQLFYDFNAMDEFEIRDDSTVQIDNRPKYAKLLKLKWRDVILADEIVVTTHNLWSDYNVNQNGALLFDKLVEEYRPNDLASVKFINILNYLKYHSTKGVFVFKIIQPKYAVVIAEKYGVTIKKFAISAKFDDEDRVQMNQIEQSFIKSGVLNLEYP